MIKHIFLAAGGTGGHIFPAQALAEELVKRGYEDGRNHAFYFLVGLTLFSDVCSGQQKTIADTDHGFCR